MAASVECRSQDRSLGMVMKEVDEDLAIFLEMWRREKENSDLNLIEKSNSNHDSTDSSMVSDQMPKVIVHEPPAAENLLDAENGQKSDYDWLLSPPVTPSFAALEKEVQETAASQTETSNALTTEPKAEPENPPEESSSVSDTFRQPFTATSINSSASGSRRPSSSGGQKSTASRFPTSTRRSALPATSKPSRSSTPAARGTVPSTKPAAPLVRSSTPSRTIARSSTQPVRSSISSASKSTPRSATPTRKPSTPSSTPSDSAPPSCSSSVNKTLQTMSKKQGASCGTSPTVRSRPKNPVEVPTSSSDAPSNLSMVVRERPPSASRGRPTTSTVKSSSTGTTITKPRQKSCSPLRGRVNAGAYNSARAVFSKRRGSSDGNDDVNPVLMGTKMVERVINMRKLAPPKPDNQPSNANSIKKSSSQDNSGFGRSLSKKSLDMAIRHMDIRRSINGNLNTIVRSVPASSVYSLRFGSTKTRTLSASDSLRATSSSASSEPSLNNGSQMFYSSDMEVNDISSERKGNSPTSQQNEEPEEFVCV